MYSLVALGCSLHNSTISLHSIKEMCKDGRDELTFMSSVAKLTMPKSSITSHKPAVSFLQVRGRKSGAFYQSMRSTSAQPWPLRHQRCRLRERGCGLKRTRMAPDVAADNGILEECKCVRDWWSEEKKTWRRKNRLATSNLSHRV